nr:6339_t:CDS:2 [Entrophospora candida]
MFCARNSQLTQQDSHATQYTNYIQDVFLGSDFLARYVVKDIHTNKHYWNTGIAHSTADVIVFKPKALHEQDVVKLFFELKKEVTASDENQAIGELFAAKCKFFRKTSTAAFAHALLKPDQLTNNHDQIRIQNYFPFFEKRARIKDPRTEDSYDEDIANLDDFEDEMTPEEHISHEMTKKLRKMLPLVPKRFREVRSTTSNTNTMTSTWVNSGDILIDTTTSQIKGESLSFKGSKDFNTTLSASLDQTRAVAIVVESLNLSDNIEITKELKI